MGKKFGDRYDAKRIQVPALMQGCIDLKPNRYENEVYINCDVDVTPLYEYIEKKKAEGEHITYFQAFLTAISKVMFSRPKLNRFVSNRHLYEHNDVTLSFVAKMSLNDKSSEIMLVVPVEKDDNMTSISQKTAEKVAKLRSKSAEIKGANKATETLAKLPNFIRIPIFGIIKGLAKRGHLPKSLTKDNIYFSSVIVSNLGSIRCGAIYHNLAEFGTCSGLMSMGEIRTVKVLDDQGQETVKKLCEFGITLDERIADGYYFAKSAKMIEYVLMHPELLEEPIGKEVEMPELR